MVASTFMQMNTNPLYSRSHLTWLTQNINEPIHYLHRVWYSVVMALITRDGRGYDEPSGFHSYFSIYDNPQDLLFLCFYSPFGLVSVACMNRT
jgi:hypothetical protein